MPPGEPSWSYDDGIVDVAAASRGALPADPQLLYERWDEVRALADRVDEGGGAARRARAAGAGAVRPARCSPSA